MITLRGCTAISTARGFTATRAAPSRAGCALPRPRSVLCAAILWLATGCDRQDSQPNRLAAAHATSVSQRVTFLERRFADDPWNYPVGTKLVDGYLLRFQLEGDQMDAVRAEAVARHVAHVSLDPGPAAARLATVLLTQHRFAEALTAARRAARLDPANAGVLGVLFDAALAAGEYAAAESALARLQPNALPRRFREAWWHEAHGDVDAAHRAMDRACRAIQRSALPADVEAWCLVELGGVERSRTGPAAARAHYEAALAVLPGYPPAIEGLADLAHARGDWARARELYRSIAADAHADLYLRLAESYRFSGDAAAAARFERQFLGLAGDAQGQRLFSRELALFAVELESLRDSALAVAQREVARRKTVDSYDVLSWVRYRRSELVAALEASDSAMAWGSPSPTALYHRARILEALGRSGEAAPLLASALERPDLLDPHARLHARQRAEGN